MSAAVLRMIRKDARETVLVTVIRQLTIRCGDDRQWRKVHPHVLPALVPWLSEPGEPLVGYVLSVKPGGSQKPRAAPPYLLFVNFARKTDHPLYTALGE